MEDPRERTFSCDARAVVPTTHGLTKATPRAGSIRTTVTNKTRGTALRIGASQGAPIEPKRKYDPLKIKYARERARRKPRRSAMAPRKMAKSHTSPPKRPARLAARSVGKLNTSCK